MLFEVSEICGAENLNLRRRFLEENNKTNVHDLGDGIEAKKVFG